MHAFMAVTCHALVDGEPFSGLSSFKAFAGSHTGEKISEARVNHHA